MTESEDIERVVKALKKVPEKKLLLIELANKIPIKNGDLDIDVLSNMAPQITLAKTEAEAYGAYTIHAVDALSRINETPKSDELEELTDDDLEQALQF